MRRIENETFEKLLPLALDWAEKWQEEFQRNGVPLTQRQIADAKLVAVNQIPTPEDPALRDAAEKLNLVSPTMRGLALGYGIFILQEHWNERGLVTHELVHVLQHERLGGIRPFLKAYLAECAQHCYPNGPLEKEAIEVTERFQLLTCGPLVPGWGTRNAPLHVPKLK